MLERNRVYFRAYQTLVFVLLLSYIVTEILEKAFGWIPTRGIVANFLTLLIFAALTLPAAILAWWDAGEEGALDRPAAGGVAPSRLRCIFLIRPSAAPRSRADERLALVQRLWWAYRIV